MTTRRDFLASVSAATAITGLAGCLDIFQDGGDNDDQIPGDGVETDDELLNALADPSSQLPPLFFSGYQYRISELGNNVDPTEIIPRAGGAVAGLFDTGLEDTSLSDVDRITGSIYNSSSSGGALEVQPFPSGQAIHATGEFEADPLITVVEDSDAHSSLGTENGYDRYLAEIQGGQGFEAWAIQDGRLVIVNRTDVTSRSSEYDSKEATAQDALAIEFDQIERDDAPIVNSAPGFADTVRTLDSGPIRAGTGYAMIPKGSDIGTAALDEVVRGVVGAGLSATVTDEPTLQRSVTYLDSETAAEETVRSAYEASDIDEISPDDWEFSTDGTTVTARATLSEQPSTAMLRTGLPVPGYQSLFTRVNPGDLNRAPTPRVFFQPSLEGGTLRIEHAGGTELETLRVRYVHEGEIRQETWDGPVGEGDQFTSGETIDSGTQAWVTWRPDTVDAAVLTRFETPE
jgi:hypothetical protein